MSLNWGTKQQTARVTVLNRGKVRTEVILRPLQGCCGPHMLPASPGMCRHQKRKRKFKKANDDTEEKKSKKLEYDLATPGETELAARNFGT